jgi:16S rRNA (guanine1207-N2)-methyltransferase
MPENRTIELASATGRHRLATAPGVFSADAVDPGSALLIEHLETIDSPTRIFDAGCGAGVLGLAALLRWPRAEALLADVDSRAIACARANSCALGLAERCRVVWWDAVREPPPEARFDLALVNPPFHTGVPVDLQPARSIFRALAATLTPGGRAWIVANRSLPWERDLREIGTLCQRADHDGYKVLEVTR